MKAEVRIESGRGRVSGRWVRRIVECALAAERVPHGSVGVLLTDDRRIRLLNKKFLAHDRPTDVISFGAGGRTSPTDAGGYLGDVVVSVETAATSARELKIPFREELARYLVHGTLHLVGYRDKKEAARKRMHRRQESILKKLGFFK